MNLCYSIFPSISDPLTGQYVPVQPQMTVDPATGQVVQQQQVMIDPNTGQVIQAPTQQTQVMLDPNTGTSVCLSIRPSIFPSVDDICQTSCLGNRLALVSTH